MKVLLYSINYSPEPIGIGKYNGEMVRWLVNQGHEVRVVTAKPYYPGWKTYPGYRGCSYMAEIKDNLIVYRCPIYVPAHPSTVRRVLHLLSFAIISLPPLVRLWKWHPHVILTVAPTLFCAPQAALLAQLSRSYSILHIQDFEVDAMFGLGMARGGCIKRAAFWLERKILGFFQCVSTISAGMLEQAKSKGVQESRLLFLPNWSDVTSFENVQVSDTFLERLRVPAGRRVVLYSGNLGEKQGLEIIVDCAVLLQDDPDIHFLIVGSGTGENKLRHLVQSKGLQNITFAPLQRSEDLPALLTSADCHLVIQRRGVADAVMPSKLTNILAAGGNTVITADSGTTLATLCQEFPGIATLVPPESPDGLMTGIKEALELPRPNRVAQCYARTHLARDPILSRFFNEVATRSQAQA